MGSIPDWKKDTNYLLMVNDLLVTPEIQRLKTIRQHHYSNRSSFEKRGGFDIFEPHGGRYYCEAYVWRHHRNSPLLGEYCS